VQLASTVAQALARHRAGPSATDVVVADAHLPDGTLLDLVAGVRSGDHDPALVVLSGLGPADDPAIAAALAQPRTAFARKPCGVDEIALCIERVRTARPRSSPPSA
jgi:ActR/RegA family two-component response regulator